MNLAAVMQELADVLATLPGVRVIGWPADQIQPPGGVISYPESIDYDLTYRRHLDKITDLPIYLMTDVATKKSARDQVGAWSAGSGEASVKQLLEGRAWQSFGEIVIKSARFDVVMVASVEYLAVVFAADITGPGA